MADICTVRMNINGNWCHASGTDEFVRGCVKDFIAMVTEQKISGLAIVTVDMTEPETREAATSADKTI